MPKNTFRGISDDSEHLKKFRYFWDFEFPIFIQIINFFQNELMVSLEDDRYCLTESERQKVQNNA